ncbi:VanW family protein [Pseudalkalibacillus berkeleyi]|uniref:VanW family protein n=1 Tax=Pseudalkalibacillus berkeleyi TaxID=1069813 RepID=A0ABS9GY81_9BACL|nr:VanW family protein [Pseudalkalibacillus berkeleyi]MCF6137689.1 VanW family protein [Pseudalkalibacillus berkeleyi]
MWMAGVLLVAQVADHSDSLTIKQQDETITVVDREDFSLEIPSTRLLEEAKFNQFIEKMDQKVYRRPINARIDDQGNIVPGKVGSRLNRQMFRRQFYTYFFGEGSLEIKVPEMDLYPKVDSELIANIRIQQIGQYVTYFNSKNESRSNNISLAAEAIDNYVIFPGETFSFNKVVGKRTEKDGYMRAPIIVKGELSEGIGGGICQVSSTLFNAVDKAGLKIVERYSHSKHVPYVPPGRDATVSWYGPDLRFQNRYNQPILIRAKRYGGSMVVKLYSSDVINYEPRKVPKASTNLPEEIKLDQEINNPRQGE